MDPKPRPNRKRYLETLRTMSPQARVAKAFELSEETRAVLLAGLRTRFPDLEEGELHQLFLNRLAQCHNRNY